MLIAFDGQKFWATSSYTEKDVVKGAGFRWDPKEKRWWTADVSSAAKLAEFADESCRDLLSTLKESKEEALVASRATDWDGDIPCPDGLAYLPYQKAGIIYALRVFGDI